MSWEARWFYPILGISRNTFYPILGKRWLYLILGITRDTFCPISGVPRNTFYPIMGSIKMCSLPCLGKWVDSIPWEFCVHTFYPVLGSRVILPCLGNLEKKLFLPYFGNLGWKRHPILGKKLFQPWIGTKFKSSTLSWDFSKIIMQFENFSRENASI